jgi:hypothetical protein
MSLTFIHRVKLLELKNGIWISNKLKILYVMYFVGFVCSPQTPYVASSSVYIDEHVILVYAVSFSTMCNHALPH